MPVETESPITHQEIFKGINAREKLKTDSFNVFNSITTANNYGKVSLGEQPHFTLAKNLFNKERPVLEVGTAYGYSSKILLKNGYKVIASDLDERHLNVLRDSLNEEERSRLTLKPGDMFKMEIEDNSLSGVIGSNILHFLTGAQIRELFVKCYRWCAPGGIVVFSCVSSYVFRSMPAGYACFDKYYRDLRNGIEWPGEYNKRDMLGKQVFISYETKDNFPDFFHVMSTEIMAREATRAGFNIYKMEHFDEDEHGYIATEEHNRRIYVSIMCIKE